MDDQSHARRGLQRIDRTRLVDDLRRLGLHAGAVVLVHASLSRIGDVEGGAPAVVQTLLESVSPGGTVLFPTLTGREHDGPDRPPRFDVRQPCTTGRIPEAARQHPAARRSLHPTHSVAAIGPEAGPFTTGHELGESPCDECSPYYRLIRRGGLILLLGAYQAGNTTLHCLEELANVPYHLQPEVTTATVVDEHGVEHTVRNRLHLWGWEREFARIDGQLLETGAMVAGRVGSAPGRLMRAAAMADEVTSEIRGDPLYLLSDHARHAWEAGSSRNAGHVLPP